jgi:putative flippase GtrA
MRKIGLYALVSVTATILAQSSLAIAFGFWKWQIIPSIFFSLAVSVVPAFFLSDLIIWRRSGDRGQVHRRAISFLIVAVIGSLLSVVVVWTCVRTASLFNFSHAQLTLIANVPSLGSALLIWIARYFVLDRVVFRMVPEPEGTEIDHPQ